MLHISSPYSYTPLTLSIPIPSKPILTFLPTRTHKPKKLQIFYALSILFYTSYDEEKPPLILLLTKNHSFVLIHFWVLWSLGYKPLGGRILCSGDQILLCLSGLRRYTMQMEKEDKNDRGTSLVTMRPPPETDFFLQWGNRKRLRCVRIRSNNTSPPHLSSSSPHLSSSNSTRIRRRITSRVLSVTSNDEKHLSFPQPSSRLTRNSEAAVTLRSESRRVSPEKEERSYTTRGSVAVVTNLEESGGGKVPPVDVNGRGHGASPGNQGGDEHTNYYHINYKNNNYSNRGGGGGGGNLTWPKLCVTLSSKEKEEDFLAMKGCKLPPRPKKRAKLIQRTILLVCPGAWLSDMSLERYEVREKKTSKKRPRGLKAMGNLESDSE